MGSVLDTNSEMATLAMALGAAYAVFIIGVKAVENLNRQDSLGSRLIPVAASVGTFYFVWTM